jgi:hypothetical protein
VSDKVQPAQQVGAKVAKSNNDESGKVQADALLVKTKSMVMAVEAKKKKEAATAVLPTRDVDSTAEEDPLDTQAFENAVNGDISEKDEAQINAAEPPKIDDIIGEYASDLLRIKAIADSKNELNVTDLKIIQAA